MIVESFELTIKSLKRKQGSLLSQKEETYHMVMRTPSSQMPNVSPSVAIDESALLNMTPPGQDVHGRPTVPGHS
ncbi:hypothetical protein Patl1_20849 [Pistacia atlantica]|uniref:Uncharacterized protein n=1 Tax=Pistacia atlantica TaxID=434234 RepID=A0ACC1BIV3_9ROSI|nr:hypothetical protein Patl1_20849 [Pistacia atlantica]